MKRSLPLKVLLVNPRKLYYPLPPLALAYLATWAKTQSPGKFQFTVCDENTGEDGEKVIARGDFDVVAFTGVTVQITRAFELARLAKTRGRPPIVVAGGVHATVAPERTLTECPEIDVVFAGEGEKPFHLFLEAIVDGAHLVRDAERLRDIPALMLPGDKEPKTKLKPLGVEEIPIPDRTIFDLDYYLRPRLVIRGIVGRATHLMASRGCPYDCSFCGSPMLWDRKVRSPASDVVVDEMEQITNLGFDGIFFQDDIFCVNKKRAFRICEGLIERKLNERIKWTAQMRPNLIGPDDRELLKTMKRAGCVQLEYGCESGSQRILDMLKVGSATVEKNGEVLRLTHEAGLRSMATFIVGTQGETAEDMAETVKFIEKYDKVLDFYQVFMSTPFPGTHMWDIAKEAGVVDDKSWDNFAMGVFDNTVFSTTVDHKLVRQTLRDLTNRSYRKVSFLNKVAWLYTRFRDDPGYVVKRFRASLSPA